MKRFICFLFIFLFSSTLILQKGFCEESTDPEPYDKEEFPQWALDLRRFEIVSLGSIPFAMIGVTMAYGAIEMNRGNMNSLPNPLSPSSLSEHEQLKVVGMTVCAGLVIGLVDYTVNVIIRHNKRKQQEMINAAKQVDVIPIVENSKPEDIEGEIQSVDDETQGED